MGIDTSVPMPRHPSSAPGSLRDLQRLQLSPVLFALQPPSKVKTMLDTASMLAAFPHPQAASNWTSRQLGAASLLQHWDSAGPWALEGWWSQCKAPACHGGDGACQDSSSRPSRGWTQHDAGPSSWRNGCHFHLLLPGREGDGGERGAET